MKQWNLTWGGSDFDEGYALTVDNSDDVYLAGNTYGFGAGNSDLVLVKYDSLGMQQWNRTWGGSNYDYGNGIAVDSSDNIYLTGQTNSFGAGSSDMVLVKYDSSGLQQWNRTWGGSLGDSGNAITVDSLDNIYIVGGTSSFGDIYGDIVIVKYDGSGVIQWYRTWGGALDDYGMGIAIDSLDNIYLGGYTYSVDMFLVKYAPDIINPVINIHKPTQNEKFREQSPDYNISIIEENLEGFWYTIDSGTTNYTIN
ncbi:unnamed protein product, partial [marine sediment metagenome]